MPSSDSAAASEQKMTPQTNIEWIHFVLNQNKREISSRLGKISFTRNEFKILYTIIINHKHAVSRLKLREILYGRENLGTDGIINVFIFRIREKLSKVGLDNLIKTARGLGYYLFQGQCLLITSELDQNTKIKFPLT